MTTVASWSPADYFRASRGARSAWARTDQQLSLDVDGLDETHEPGAVRLVEPATAVPLPSDGSGLDPDTNGGTQ